MRKFYKEPINWPRRIKKAIDNKKELSIEEWENIVDNLSKEDIEDILKAVAKRLSKTEMKSK